jgi:hypothetical protein
MGQYTSCSIDPTSTFKKARRTYILVLIVELQANRRVLIEVDLTLKVRHPHKTSIRHQTPAPGLL